MLKRSRNRRVTCAAAEEFIHFSVTVSLLSLFCFSFVFNTIKVEPDDLCNHVHVMIIGAVLMIKAAAAAARLC